MQQILQQAIDCHQQGKWVQAESLYQQILAAQPSHSDALHLLGLLRYQKGRTAEALHYIRSALQVNPKHPAAWTSLGVVHAALNKHSEALASYDKALALDPAIAEIHNNRGNALRMLKRHAEALASFDRALAIKPDYAEALSNRALALADLRQHEDALSCFDRALAINPDHVEFLRNKGVLLLELGRLAEAKNTFAAAIKLAPKGARLYYNLALCGRFAPDDRHFQAMIELAQDAPSLSADEQIYLHFALGKAFADIGNHELSIQHWLDGSALKRRHAAYDEAATLDVLRTTRVMFNSELMREKAGLGEPSSLPIFILGMPRSGTTLIEQILASHPKAFGAGEIPDFSDAIVELAGGDVRKVSSLEFAARMSGEQLHRLGTNYVERIRAAAPAAEKIINKMPENFRFIGLIHLALPNARIIHTRRNPTDTCLSCFSTLFSEGQPYSYDLKELGRYYCEYEALMAHWRSVLPKDVMLEVQYEEVVDDLEREARRIVAHCGLQWDANCLDFHRAERQVRTASMAQVRQPIYTSSVGRWRLYQPFLGPLLDELRSSSAMASA